MLATEQELGIGERTTPNQNRSSRINAEVSRLSIGHNLFRILAGSEVRYTHFIPVTGVNEDGSIISRLFPIKCTGTPDCIFCRLGSMETDIAKKHHTERGGTFDFRSSFDVSKTWNWVVLDYGWVVSENKTAPEVFIPKIMEVKKTVDDLLNEKIKAQDAGGRSLYPKFHNYIWDIVQSEIPEAERSKGRFAKKYRFNIEVFRNEAGGEITEITKKELEDISKFLEDNKFLKIKDYYMDWCSPITKEDQIRSLGDRFSVDLDSPKIIYKEELKERIFDLGLKALSARDVKALASGVVDAEVETEEDNMEVIEDGVFDK